MSATSLGNPQSNNLYAYVQNNPVDNTDPSGLLKAATPDIGTFTVTVTDTSRSEMEAMESLLMLMIFSREMVAMPSAPTVDGGKVGEVTVLDGGPDLITRNDGRPPEQVRQDVYKKYGNKINICTGKVFGKDYEKLGKNRTENISNAPMLDATKTASQLDKITGFKGTDSTFKVPIKGNGLIYIDKADFVLAEKSDFYAEELERAFVHELGNILSKRISNSAFKYGYKNGIGKTYADKDTGAKFEECVFGNVRF